MMNLKLKLLFTVLTVGIFTFIACDKENRMGDVNSETPKNEVVLQLAANKIPLSTLVLNPNDKVEEYINKKNVELCEVLKPLFLKPDFNKFVVETAKKNKGKVSYKQLFEAFPETKALFKNTILGKRDKGSLNTRNGDLYDFERNGYYYDAMLYVPNYENAQATNQVVLSPEIQSPQQETGQGDVYFAWYGQGEVIVNEGESQNMTVAVVVTSLEDVTPHHEPTTDEPSANEVAGSNWRRQPKSSWLTSGSQGTGLNTRGGVSDPHAIWMPRSKLNYNYDDGSDPDLYVVGVWIKNDGQEFNWGIRGEDQLELRDDGRECEFFDNDEEKIFTFYDWFSQSTSFNQNFWRDKTYFFNAWERDWGSNCKPLGRPTHAGKELNFTGARKFTDEWYIYSPYDAIRLKDALPMQAMFNEPGAEFFPNPTPDPRQNGEPVCTTFGIKAEISFSRGLKF
jgi:hypothetical protein